MQKEKERILNWLNAYKTEKNCKGVVLGLSGGKDSTVLLHLVRQIYPDVPAVFSNTGLEYPEIVKFAHSFENPLNFQLLIQQLK